MNHFTKNYGYYAASPCHSKNVLQPSPCEYFFQTMFEKHCGFQVTRRLTDSLEAKDGVKFSNCSILEAVTFPFNGTAAMLSLACYADEQDNSKQSLEAFGRMCHTGKQDFDNTELLSPLIGISLCLQNLFGKTCWR